MKALTTLLLVGMLAMAVAYSQNEPQFQTNQLPNDYDYLAPDGSEIRLFPKMTGGGLAHYALPPDNVSTAVHHQTVEEIGYFIEGEGEVWRKREEREEVVSVRSGVKFTIPIGTHFQFGNTGERTLVFLISTMPPWPGANEAIEVEGYW